MSLTALNYAHVVAAALGPPGRAKLDIKIIGFPESHAF
jgi:hypothetical protein